MRGPVNLVDFLSPQTLMSVGLRQWPSWCWPSLLMSCISQAGNLSQMQRHTHEIWAGCTVRPPVVQLELNLQPISKTCFLQDCWIIACRKPKNIFLLNAPNSVVLMVMAWMMMSRRCVYHSCVIVPERSRSSSGLCGCEQQDSGPRGHSCTGLCPLNT